MLCVYCVCLCYGCAVLNIHRIWKRKTKNTLAKQQRQQQQHQLQQQFQRMAYRTHESRPTERMTRTHSKRIYIHIIRMPELYRTTLMRNGSYIPNNIHGISFARWVQMLLLCSGYGFFSSFVFVWCAAVAAIECAVVVVAVAAFFSLFYFSFVRIFVYSFVLALCVYILAWYGCSMLDVCWAMMNECSKRIWISFTERIAHECDRNGECKNKCVLNKDGKNHGQTHGIDTDTCIYTHIIHTFSTYILCRRESNLCIIVWFGSVWFGIALPLPFIHIFLESYRENLSTVCALINRTKIRLIYIHTQRGWMNWSECDTANDSMWNEEN